MVAGVLLGIVGLAVTGTANTYTQFVIGHAIAQIFLNGAAAAYYAIIPDHEFGKASGSVILFFTLGRIFVSRIRSVR